MFIRISVFLPVILFFLVMACEPVGTNPDQVNTAPRAVLQISPSIGDSTRVFVLTGENSSDAEDISQFLEYRWDLNDDSVWDTGYDIYPALLKHFTIPGTYRIRMEVRDRFGLTDQATGTLKTYGINNDTSSFTDPRDGQTYRTVRISGTWWMAENLNFGTMIRDTQLSRNNGIYEKYSYQDNPGLQGPSGGYFTYYDWDEVMDYDTSAIRGLCPPGWKMPDRADWDTLLYPFWDRGLYVYFGEGGFSRLNLTGIGFHELTKSWEPIDESPCTAFWMYLTRDFEKDFYKRKYMPCPVIVSSSYFVKYTQENIGLIRFVNDSVRRNGAALPVRCVKIEE
jgi:hypothetical protein